MKDNASLHYLLTLGKFSEPRTCHLQSTDNSSNPCIVLSQGFNETIRVNFRAHCLAYTESSIHITIITVDNNRKSLKTTWTSVQFREIRTNINLVLTLGQQSIMQSSPLYR